MAVEPVDPVTGRVRPGSDLPTVVVEPDMVLLHRPSGLRGRVRRFTGQVVVLRDAKGGEHTLSYRPGAFAHRGETVALVRRAPGSAPTERRSASGAVVAVEQTARVARADRIWVEGDHDARLLERVWGDELREHAIVVESLGGLDHVVEALAEFGPGPGRRVVVLADHLVAGSKESRMAEGIASEFVHVVGHDHVDVWQCVRPSSVGIASWPEVPRGEDWKTGVCVRLGWDTPAEGWSRVLSAVSSFADLEPTLVGAVERALDLLVDGEAGR